MQLEERNHIVIIMAQSCGEPSPLGKSYFLERGGCPRGGRLACKCALPVPSSCSRVDVKYSALKRRCVFYGGRDGHFPLLLLNFVQRSVFPAPFVQRFEHFALRSAPFVQRSAHFALRSAHFVQRSVHFVQRSVSLIRTSFSSVLLFSSWFALDIISKAE